MRLGFYYHTPAYIDDQGCIWTAGEQGVFIEGLAAYCDEVVCFLHTPNANEMEMMNYPLSADNVTVVSTGPRGTLQGRILRAGRIASSLRPYRNRLDAMLLRGPSPLMPAFGKAGGDLPLVLLLIADNLAGMKDLQNKSPLTKLLILAWKHWNRLQQLRISRRALNFVNSELLYQQWEPLIPNLHRTRTTTLSNKDFFEREDTCLTEPFRLLYTGRIIHAKGVMNIFQAFLALLEQGRDVRLDLVGFLKEGDSIWDDMHAIARQKGIEDRVTYHGFKRLGPELFNYYRQADIYVIASLSDFEGFPRTVWEAMAASVPVVATRVGSIPIYLDHAETAMLVEPRNVTALTGAIATLLDDSDLRRRLIRQGRALAQENTVETRSYELTEAIKAWCSSRQDAG